MEHELADLSLDDREEEGFGVPTEVGLQSTVSVFSIVGYFLTASIVHFSAMKSTMVNVWHLVKGVQISDLGDKHFCFKFFHRIDLERVINGAHWTFNNHLLVFHRLEMGEDSVKVPLLYGEIFKGLMVVGISCGSIWTWIMIGEEIPVENVGGKKRLRNEMGDYNTRGWRIQ
ncbi:hypothetical protein Goshw_007333 [Gossypium schwendimanii]|uniref:DUF4283 domain-containing protein n=1 Tax=Gossypium schwendimanii TaxID=34291 RepID=A0A7J9NFL2_GOSSC|nr:hypothetical protein [Gossypium schwendimanii]